jgi:hypothetical protein
MYLGNMGALCTLAIGVRYVLGNRSALCTLAIVVRYVP